MKTEDHMILPDLDEGVMTGNNSVLPNKQEAPSVWLAPENFEELGFFLAIDRDRNGNIIRRIERGGPADRAGLRDGDRILG